MIMDSLHFVYDGISSSDMGLFHVNLKGGMLEQGFVASRKIIEETTMGRVIPYFQGIEYQPLEFSFTFAFDNYFDDRKVAEVASWLCQNYYKPFYFSDSPEKVVFVMMEGDSKLIHNGLRQGYVEINMRANSPYVYSQQYIKDYTCNGSTNIVFENLGNVILQPEMWITKIGAGDITIVNRTHGNFEFKIKGLHSGEEVYIDNENKFISSPSMELTNNFRYDDFNGNYLELVYGSNDLLVTGSCEIKFKYRCKDLT